MKKDIKRNFTLMELLAVIAIVSVLFTVMLPGFKKMVKGNAVDQMASQVKLMLEKAQSQAVTSRRYVAVIFPNGSWEKPDGREIRMGGARLAYVKDIDKVNSACKFVSWVNGEDWRFPIEGASLVSALNKDDTKYSKVEMKDILSKKNGEGTPENFTLSLFKVTDYPDTPTTRANCALIFSPYGEVLNQAT